MYNYLKATIVGNIAALVMVVATGMAASLIVDMVAANINNVAYIGSIDEVFATAGLALISVLCWVVIATTYGRQEDDNKTCDYLIGSLTIFALGFGLSIAAILASLIAHVVIDSNIDTMLVIKASAVAVINAILIAGLLVRYRTK